MFDNYFKSVFKDNYGDAVKSNVAIGTLEKSFDLWIQGDHPNIRISDIIPSIFKLFIDNIIQYKSKYDQYSMTDILKLIGDGCYFEYNRKIDFAEAIKRTCFWFIAVNPNPFKKEYQNASFIPTEESGIYRLQSNIFQIYAIIINELDPEKWSNSLLLLFSSETTLQKFLRNLLKMESIPQSMKNYLSLKYILEIKELEPMTEMQDLRKKFSIGDNIRYAIEKIGIGNVIAEVGLDKVIAEVGLDKVIAEVGLDKVIAEVGLDKVIDIIGVEKLEQEIKKRKKSIKKRTGKNE